MYTFFADEKRFTSKPSKNEIPMINKRFHEVTANYLEIAHNIGKYGTTFTVASFNSKRTNEDFKEEQLFALDFDSGIKFSEVKSRLDFYHIPILFAYKTFSWNTEHEKFRIVIGLDHIVTDLFTAQKIILILMELFPECDKACKDPARMFFGGKGLLYLNDKDEQLSYEQLFLCLDECMRNKYEQKHYTEHLKKFYQKHSIASDKNGRIPVIAVNEISGKNLLTIQSEAVHREFQQNNTCNVSMQKRRSVVKNFDWNALYNCCELYRNFADGTEYYYYPELFHIALNMCSVDGGRKKFIEILNSEKNQNNESYFARDWKSTLNDIIKHEYLPKNCNNCPYADTCCHGTNMISTANPSSRDVKIIEQKQYCSLEEAEISLKENFYSALGNKDSKIKIILAQTGIGKTRLYIDMLKNTDEAFVIVVPTHELAAEIYQRAVNSGIEDIISSPRQPVLSDEIQRVIDHYYEIGAGELAIREYRDLLEKLNKNSIDYMTVKCYLDRIDEMFKFDGHIIITHQRFLCLSPLNKVFDAHRIIIDEDIMTSVFSVKSVSKNDIQKLMNKPFVSANHYSLLRLKSIYHGREIIKFDYGAKLNIEKENLSEMTDINGNVLELLSAREIIADRDNVSYLNVKELPYNEIIIMSATANPELYKLMMPDREIQVYRCREARYTGKIAQYTDYTYSRGSINRNDEIIEKLKEECMGYEIITFAEFERIFGTKYHFGGVEGLDILKGKNICIIGTPNINDYVYKLYGMKAGVSNPEANMKKLRIQHNGYEFSLYTYENPVMQIIQIWFIESLLEQAIGRARLIRYNCEVKVYSGFPVAQAKFITV